MAENTKCKHDLCVCPATEDSDYCSDFCENSAESDMIAIKCDCGHPGCA